MPPKKRKERTYSRGHKWITISKTLLKHLESRFWTLEVYIGLDTHYHLGLHISWQPDPLTQDILSSISCHKKRKVINNGRRPRFFNKSQSPGRKILFTF